MLLVVKSAFGLLKALSNGIFSKVAKTWSPGGWGGWGRLSAKSRSIANATHYGGWHLQWVKTINSKDLLCTVKNNTKIFTPGKWSSANLNNVNWLRIESFT